MKKKISITISVTVVLILLGWAVFHLVTKNNKTVYYWRTSPVEKGDINIIVTSTGSIAADTTVSVGTQVTGILKKQYVDFNSIVKKGEIIAIIDTTTLYPTMLDAKASLDKAQAQCDEYKRELDRAKNMFENKVNAQADYDLAIVNFETAKATVESMKAQLNRAETNLRYATIRAPISGVVISRTYDEGITVIASFNTPTLFVIANDLKKMQVQADVDEADIGQVKEGQDVSFTVDAYPDDVFTGKVKQVRLNPIMVGNVVNFVVIIEAPNPDMKLIPGLTANINIKVKVHSGILKVPANALNFTPPVEYLNSASSIPDSIKRKIELRAEQISKKIILPSEETMTYVWVEKGLDIFPVQVKKGLTDGIFSEISGEIKEGEMIVTGINTSAASVQSTSKSSSQQNPFMPKFPPHKPK